MLLPQLPLQQMLLLMQQSWKRLPEAVSWAGQRPVGSSQFVLGAVESQKGVNWGFAVGWWPPCFAGSEHGVPLDCRSWSKQASNLNWRETPSGPVSCTPHWEPRATFVG